MSNILKLLTYNIQTAISMNKKSHYILNSWKHFLPHKSKQTTLDYIAQLISPYDIAAFQEVDSGSFRSSFINQVEYLSRKNLIYWDCQITRDLGYMAQHAKGIISKHKILNKQQIILPSKVPGRGAQIITICINDTPIKIVNVHLSLLRKAQIKQIAYLIRQLDPNNPLIIMGDFNVNLHAIWKSCALHKTTLSLIKPNCKTFPSWKPTKAIDSILISHHFNVLNAGTIPTHYSDHLPFFSYIKLSE